MQADWTARREAYVACVRRLDEELQRTLAAHNAIDMQAESNFIGYIRLEPDGRFSNEIWRWGVCRGKLFYADTIEAVKDVAFETLG